MVTQQVDTQQVFDWISDIPDPEIPVISIKDLGMLRQVEFDNNNYVVTITPTYTACPAMKMIEDEILDTLQRHNIDNVKVQLTYEPAWTTDWLTEVAKLKMKNYGIAPPQHSACSKVFSKNEEVVCPRCNSKQTELISRFGSTACKALYKCAECKEPFDYFKCH
ncbi:MAG TPA: phenylacetate-CoA oxygenase subunit PaaJ [Bacteroidia bacterium]|nr:phenylacetate-CoA oxygenase subunit PaaJ [Bacteroidia bacterium]